jgi:hypothetical protein
MLTEEEEAQLREASQAAFREWREFDKHEGGKQKSDPAGPPD